jgi:trimeric autotransporter adhesin
MGSPTEYNDGSWLYINGGNITVSASKGDGLDSNGSAAVTAGTVIVQGPPSQPEVGFDINGSFNVSGGLVIGSGPNSGNMIEGISTTSSQNGLKATISSNLAASTLFHIQDASGNELITFKPVRSCYYIVYSSSLLVTGSRYYIYTGGASTGTLTNGIYAGGTYSGGTSRANFTVSSRITNISF